MKFKTFVKDTFLGATMGLGMVPGVSAGTMGVISGIYDKLIDNVNTLRKDFKRSFLTLLPIGIGFVLSSIFFLLLTHKLYGYAPIAISCACAGIIIGSLPTITKEVKGEKIDWKFILLFLAGFIVSAGLGILSALAELYWHFDLSAPFANPTWWVYLLCVLAGFIAAVAMVIPGISGSMILFLCGMYLPIVNYFSLSYPGSMFNDSSKIVPGILIIISIVIGVLIGVLTVAKAMKVLLVRQRANTFKVVLGFVIGSIISMFISNNMIIDATSTTPATWVYAKTPLWEWVVSPILLIAMTALFFYLTYLRPKAKAKKMETNIEN
ncbi:MAG: DUF368 domain-containing protein [Bacilli bacterium]|nr:DUF368 domain-containing protein [Bacilli bacterium]